MNRQILIVDDDPNILAAFSRSLRKDFDVDTANGAIEAINRLESGKEYAVAMVDMRMPGINGIEFLEILKVKSPQTVRLMLTGNVDQQTAIDAINRSRVFRFLNKPVEPEVIHQAFSDALAHYHAREVERVLLEETLAGSVRLLVDVLAMVAPDALERGQRLRDSMMPFARAINAESLWELELGALLSSLGYTSVPPSVLQKFTDGSPLTIEEAKLRRDIPMIGHNLLVTIPRMEGIAKIIRYQRHNFDGSTEPNSGMAGEALPLGARMLKILNDRLDLEDNGVVKRDAFLTMKGLEGHYDPTLLVKCFACFGTFMANPISAKLPVLSVHAHDLKPGQVVVAAITGRTGAILANSGLRLTVPVIERIRNYERTKEVMPPFLVQDAPAEETA